LYATESKLDGIFADVYYTYLNKHWSFGISYLKNSLGAIATLIKESDMNLIQDSVRKRNLNPNCISIDQYFDFARATGKLKLKAFALEDTLLIRRPGIIQFLQAKARWV